MGTFQAVLGLVVLFLFLYARRLGPLNWLTRVGIGLYLLGVAVWLVGLAGHWVLK